MEFEKLFIESKGQPIKYKGKELKMIDRVALPASKILLQIDFIATDSIWTQGIVLQTKGEFEVNGQKMPNKTVLWEDTAPKQVKIIITSKDKTLCIYNVWEITDHLGNKVTHYWYNGGALFLEKINETTTIYHCNDGFPDDDFDDLIFKVEVQTI